MSERTKLNMLRWFIIEVVTIIIAGIHIIFFPANHAYGIPLFIVLCIGLVAWVIVWLALKRKENG